MESAGNAVIDFGRFCTGFLVVMGIGTSAKQDLQPNTLTQPSAAHTTRSYGTDTNAGNGHVNSWGPADLWHDHKLLPLLSRRARLLRLSSQSPWLTDPQRRFQCNLAGPDSARSIDGALYEMGFVLLSHGQRCPCWHCIQIEQYSRHIQAFEDHSFTAHESVVESSHIESQFVVVAGRPCSTSPSMPTLNNRSAWCLGHEQSDWLETSLWSTHQPP